MHSAPNGSTVSHYESLKQVEETRGVAPPELACAPVLPEECENAFHAFQRISKILYSEIEAYQNITGDLLKWWEIEILFQLNHLRGCEPKWQPK